MLKEIARELKRQKSRSPKKEKTPPKKVMKKKVEPKKAPVKVQEPKSLLEHTTDRLYKMAPAIKARKEAFIKE
jgi:hypothetical protein